MNEQIIREAIDSILDPDLAITLKDLNAIQSMEIEGMSISVYIELYPPVHWIAKVIEDQIREKILAISEGYDIRIYVREIITPRAKTSHCRIIRKRWGRKIHDSCKSSCFTCTKRC